MTIPFLQRQTARCLTDVKLIELLRIKYVYKVIHKIKNPDVSRGEFCVPRTGLAALIQILLRGAYPKPSAPLRAAGLFNLSPSASKLAPLPN